MTTICVDAMGGDESPQLVCEGIAAALAADPELEVLVVGDEDVVTDFCERTPRATPLVSTQSIEMDEHPTEAVRSKPDSSIVKGCKAVRTGAADGFFSAGSTGAILVAATLNVGRIKGVTRPGIVTTLPSVSDHLTVLCDLGANSDATPAMIVQFARMGAAYATSVTGVTSPKIGLLSNGTEDTKGNETTLAYHEALVQSDVDFAGNCEGYDLLMGDFDVIVCDGFAGNVALKSMEGTAKYISAKLKKAAASSPITGIGALLIKPAFKEVAAALSGDEMGGACLMGLKHPVLIGHGATSVDAVKNGTLATARLVHNDLCGKLAESLSATS